MRIPSASDGPRYPGATQHTVPALVARRRAPSQALPQEPYSRFACAKVPGYGLSRCACWRTQGASPTAFLAALGHPRALGLDPCLCKGQLHRHRRLHPGGDGLGDVKGRQPLWACREARTRAARSGKIGKWCQVIAIASSRAGANQRSA